ncbi:MAG: glycosyltransferase family 1 protein [Capsulimonadales bacterium]|nr:glycosyltransferase family 1 protein [Capsulimonadales bacterium]
MKDLPRIVLDARPLTHPQTGGFRTYVRSLLTGLAERERDGLREFRLLIYTDRPLTGEAAACLPESAEVRTLDCRRLRTDFRLFAEQVRRDRPDLVHGTMNYLPLGIRGAATVTIHDAMGVRLYPWSFRVSRTARQWAMTAYWRGMTERSARRAKGILTVSQGAAAELSRALSLPAGSLTVVYNGISPPRTLDGPPRAHDVVLMMASSDRRKNPEVVYRAMVEERRRWSQGAELRVVCGDRRTADRAEAVLREGRAERFRVLVTPGDGDLSRLYSQATVFVWSSRHEGFGLPPLEAMGAGCPVLSSSAPVMPEILGEAPRYFDPECPAQLATELDALLSSPTERAERGVAGRRQAAEYSCRRMAEGTVDFWRRAIVGAGGS